MPVWRGRVHRQQGVPDLPGGEPGTVVSDEGYMTGGSQELLTYMRDFRDKLMAHNLPWDGPVVIEPRGTREPRGGVTKPPVAGDPTKTYPTSGDNLQVSAAGDGDGPRYDRRRTA